MAPWNWFSSESSSAAAAQGGPAAAQGRPLRGKAGSYFPTETLSFARNPLQFVTERAAQYGKIFATYIPSASRSLSGNTAVACGYDEACAVLLSEAAVSASAAYGEYLGVYEPGSNLVLAGDLDGDESKHHRLRRRYDGCCASEAVAGYMSTILTVVGKHVDAIGGGGGGGGQGKRSLDPYVFSKRLFDELTAVLLLGEDPNGHAYEASDVRRWRREHFAAMTSAPLQIELFGGIKSGMARGLQARDSLLELLRARIASERALQRAGAVESRRDTVLSYLVGADETGARDEEAAHHLLMLANAVSSKSPAAAVTYLILELVEDHEKRDRCIEDESYLAACLYETLRLHPPLLGGLRRTTDATNVAGYHIPTGHRLWYSCRHANTDPSVYSQPHHFVPGRWHAASCEAGEGDRMSKCPVAFPAADSSKPDPPSVTFGAGSHRCPGRDLAWAMMMTAAKSILHNFEITPGQESGTSLADQSERFFPVLRPDKGVSISIKARSVR